MTAVNLSLPSALTHDGRPRTPALVRFTSALTPSPRTSSKELR
jgi:hypothetical protein